MAEPIGEGLFAFGGAGAGDQFKETAAAEEVKVFGIGMGGVAEALAGVAVADPIGGGAAEGGLVEGDGAAGMVLLAADAFVLDGEGDEGGDGEPEHGEGQGF